MDEPPRWRWLVLAAAILAVFLGVVSTNMERLHGGSFIALCLIAVLLGGVGYVWARDRVLPIWERLPNVRRLLLIGLMAAIVLAGRLIANWHNSDERFVDLMVGVGVLAALVLWGLYPSMTHFWDSLHSRRH